MRQQLDFASGMTADLQASQERVEQLQAEVQQLREVTADQEAAAAAEQELRSRVGLPDCCPRLEGSDPATLPSALAVSGWLPLLALRMSSLGQALADVACFHLPDSIHERAVRAIVCRAGHASSCFLRAE